jgi:hypothetical protein
MVDAKRISVSFPPADQAFCREKNLSPSRLLQERITQIRDGSEVKFKDALAEQQKHNENLTKKLSFFTDRFQKLWDKHAEGLTEAEQTQLQEELF